MINLPYSQDRIASRVRSDELFEHTVFTEIRHGKNRPSIDAIRIACHAKAGLLQNADYDLGVTTAPYDDDLIHDATDPLRIRRPHQ